MKLENALVAALLLAGCGPRYVNYKIWPEPEEAFHEQSGIAVRAYPVGGFNNKLAIEVRNQRDTSLTLILSRSVLMNEDSVVQRWPGAGTTQGLSVDFSSEHWKFGKKGWISVWKTERSSSETLTTHWDTIAIPPMAKWVDTVVTFSPETHTFRKDAFQEELDSLEAELKMRYLAGVSLAFQGEMMTFWVRGNKIGKIKESEEKRIGREQRDIILAVSSVVLLILIAWLMR